MGKEWEGKKLCMFEGIDLIVGKIFSWSENLVIFMKTEKRDNINQYFHNRRSVPFLILKENIIL